MSLISKALDIILPPLCLACETPVNHQGALCSACWSGIQFIAAPYCARCGAPFDTPVGEGEICAPCLTAPPVFTAARAAMLYDDASRRLILGFKHGDRTHLAQSLAGWMRRAAGDLVQGGDVIIPVPLHRWRLFKRRYNQAALLAQAIGQMSGLPVLVDGLLRLRATPTQGHRNRKERAANVKNAFALDPRAASRVQGQNVILVDDVLTTGATLNECSRVLNEAGAAGVRVLTLARVRNFIV